MRSSCALCAKNRSHVPLYDELLQQRSRASDQIESGNKLGCEPVKLAPGTITLTLPALDEPGAHQRLEEAVH